MWFLLLITQQYVYISSCPLSSVFIIRSCKAKGCSNLKVNLKEAALLDIAPSHKDITLTLHWRKQAASGSGRVTTGYKSFRCPRSMRLGGRRRSWCERCGDAINLFCRWDSKPRTLLTVLTGLHWPSIDEFDVSLWFRKWKYGNWISLMRQRKT